MPIRLRQSLQFFLPHDVPRLIQHPIKHLRRHHPGVQVIGGDLIETAIHPNDHIEHLRAE